MSEEQAATPCPGGEQPAVRDRFTLEQSVHAAARLLAYAASQGLELDKEVIEKIVASGKLLCLNTNDPATFPQQVEFWVAYDKLTSAVQPVTTESIEAITSVLPRRGLCARLRETLFGPRRASDKAIRRYKWWASVALVSVLLLQAYWGVGSRLNAQVTELRTGIQEIQEKISGDASGADAEDRAGRLEALNDELSLRNDSLKKWNMVWKTVFKVLTFWTADDRIEAGDGRNPVKEPPHKELGRNRLDTILALEVLELYVLPLLFGWLGSCLFVLRSLAKEIGAVSYSTEENMVYRIRLFTGALAGLVIGGFGLLRDAASPLASLTPFALAFIAGYSVDLFIAAMDKIIAAFTAKEGGQKA
ncbi:hypothetical protein [Desulfovibrio aminophilus]|uniref:hypothetical protein n=1 Tax=Desulfovibrio aminophilus TaxID=81425 RepID=UPI0004225C30|nr:hypothetical protein [Desulfovibrio aminophilus]